MRMIDADEIHPDVRTQHGALAISQGQLAYAKTVNAIPIPYGATNGDMIKDIFPTFRTEDLSHTVWVGYDQMSFKRDWWNAPYNPPKQNLAPADKSGLEYADQPTLQSAT